eukprot:1537409-Rhodomonas_salina.1
MLACSSLALSSLPPPVRCTLGRVALSSLPPVRSVGTQTGAVFTLYRGSNQTLTAASTHACSGIKRTLPTHEGASRHEEMEGQEGHRGRVASKWRSF